MGPGVSKGFCPGHIPPPQGAANSIPNPQHVIIDVLGTLQEGNFTPINRNIDPSGKGLSRAAPEHLCQAQGPHLCN